MDPYVADEDEVHVTASWLNLIGVESCDYCDSVDDPITDDLRPKDRHEDENKPQIKPQNHAR